MSAMVTPPRDVYPHVLEYIIQFDGQQSCVIGSIAKKIKGVASRAKHLSQVLAQGET